MSVFTPQREMTPRLNRAGLPARLVHRFDVSREAACAGNYPPTDTPALSSMNPMALRRSSSVRCAKPPFGGIAPFPLMEDWRSPAIPCASRGSHAAGSSSFGASATPVMWHAKQAVW